MLLLSLITGICAQATGGSVVPDLSLDQAVSRTIERNPGLVAFGYQIKAQQGRVLQSGLEPNPELSLLIENGLGTGEFGGLSGAETTLSLAWVLEREKRDRRVDAAQAGALGFEVEAEIRRLDAAAETAKIFLQSLAEQERLLWAKSAVTLSRQTMEAVQRRVKAGKTPKADLARAEADLAQSELEREDVEHVLQTAYRRLAAQWGEIEPDFLSVSGAIYKLPTPEPYSDLRARINQNPDLGRYLSEQRLLQAELRLTEAMAVPSWRVSAGLRRLERTDVDKKAVRIRVETQLFTVYQELLHSLHRARTMREVIIPLTEQAFTDTKRAYELGRYGYLEWRAVQQELLAARAALVEASVDALHSVIEIERLTGVSLSSSAAEQ